MSGIINTNNKNNNNTSSGTSVRDGSYTYKEHNVEIRFPFEPYYAQKQMMSKMIQAFENKENAILESPTGSGKSLAILCAALAWAKHKNFHTEAPSANSWRSNDYLDYDDDDDDGWNSVRVDTGGKKPRKRKIYIGSRTHKQIAQLVKELKQNTIYQPQMAVLGSRVQYCIEETVRKSENLLDECAKLCENCNMSKEDKADKKIQAMRYDYKRARKDFISIMDDLSLNDNNNDGEDIFFVNNTVYDDDPESKPKKIKKAKKAKKKLKKVKTGDLDNDTICLDDDDEDKECIPYKNTALLEGHPDLRRDASHFLWDIEDLVLLGREVNGCPYFASRALAKDAEVIFCPYNYLIDPSIKASLNIDLENDIVIIDEAHNIENVCRDAGSFETTYPDLLRVKVELIEALRSNHLIHPNQTMLDTVNKIMTWFTESDFDFSDGEKSDKLLKCWSARTMLPQLEAMDITISSFSNRIKPAFDKILEHYNKQSGEDRSIETEEEPDEDEYTDRKTISTRSVRVLERLVLILGFIFDTSRNYVDDYILGVLKKKPQTIFGRVVEEPMAKVLEQMELCLWTMNPGIVFNQISSVAHSVILTSGTLTPMETFVSELQANFPIKLVADHVINGSQVWAGVIPTGPNNASLHGIAKYTSQNSYQQGVCEALYNIAHNVPYGVLCFFSSYRVMNLIIDCMKQSGLYESLERKKQIFIEPRNVTAEVFNKELNRYYKCIKDAENKGSLNQGQNGGLFFAVFRGKVSEGIDFNNNNCRAVCCVGIPFPNYGDALVKLKQGYNNTKRSKLRWDERNKYLSGYEWYEIQGYRALNQALGRCIRHRKDWGAIILLETRFQQPEKRAFLSRWVASLCNVHHGIFPNTMNNLKTFMDQHVQKAKEERDRLRVEHPEDFNHWDDCIGVTRSNNDLDPLIKMKREWETDIKKEIKKDPLDDDDDWGTLLDNTNIKKEPGKRKKERTYDDMDILLGMDQVDVKYEPSSSTIKKERNYDDLDILLGMDKVDVKSEEIAMFDNDDLDSILNKKGKRKATNRAEDMNRNDCLLDNWGDNDLLDSKWDPIVDKKPKSESKPYIDSDDDDVIFISDTPFSPNNIVPEATNSTSHLKRQLCESNGDITFSSNEQKKPKYEIIEID